MKTEINYISKETTEESKKMLTSALSLIKDKNCVTWNGRHACIDRMVANMGHNIYTTDITLRDQNNGVQAYFFNGQFWSAITKQLLTLI
jgi:hypothetical protein